MLYCFLLQLTTFHKYFYLLFFLHEIFITAICPYDCGGSTRGACTSLGMCRCNPGYTGTYCMDGKFMLKYKRRLTMSYLTSVFCVSRIKFFFRMSQSFYCKNGVKICNLIILIHLSIRHLQLLKNISSIKQQQTSFLEGKIRRQQDIQY